MKKFTTSCFIRKNTPALREKLEELGYMEEFPLVGDLDSLFVHTYENGSVYDEMNIPSPYHSGCYAKGFIDCSTNEPLFLAIAALREDSDYGQWLTGKDGYMILNMEDNSWKLDKNWFHKATVSELIEYFKKENHE